MIASSWQAEAWMLARLAVAALLGGLVGYERERAAKPAGVRTHGMVSLGAALFAVLSFYGFGDTGDPARVAAQIVSGIGFLGAGLILHQRGSVHRITSAASLWVTAAIGMAMGVGMILMALAATVLVYGLLRFGPRPRPPGADTLSGDVVNELTQG
jgi:putative Mg2+ transporter-C (MgtC) family protein